MNPVVFNDMTVTLPTDRICAVMGRGKNERGILLRLLSGLDRPDHGCIVTQTAFSVIGHSAMLFHGKLTGLENITLAARVHGMPPTMLTEMTVGLMDYGDDWEIPAGHLPGPRRKSMEMLLALMLPYDCFLVEDADRVDPEIFARILQVTALRGAGVILTAQNPKFARQYASFCGVIDNQTVYAFNSVDEALKYYA